MLYDRLRAAALYTLYKRKEYLQALEDHRIEQAETLLQELIQRTPRDTGHAAASWTIEHQKGVSIIRNSADYIVEVNNDVDPHFIEATALKYGTPRGLLVRET